MEKLNLIDMPQKEKELLLADLCSRLPYNVKVKYYSMEYPYGSKPVILTSNLLNDRWENISSVMPYLRPLSSMTEEEKEIYKSFCDEDIRQLSYVQEVHPSLKQKTSCHRSIDWLNAHHFDYRGLIEKGLALEAPEGMYKNI